MDNKLKSIRECKHSVFISYAHADDELYDNWATNFYEKIQKRLKSSTPGIELPVAHLSEWNGSVRGVLSDELRDRVAASFATILIVGENYANSKWCLAELEYFKSTFGDSGFRDRLYILALSKAAIDQVTKNNLWRSIFPKVEEQIWMAFYTDAEENTPVRVLAETGKGCSDEFWKRFVRLTDSLSGSIKASVLAPDATTSKRATRETRSLLFGVSTPSITDAVENLCQSFPGATMLDVPALTGELSEFNTAETLVLAFDNSQPLMPHLPGGHLAFQLEAWEQKRRSSDDVVWVDMRQHHGTVSIANEHAEFLRKSVKAPVKPEELLRLYVQPDSGRETVRIFIESNGHEHERILWKTLGEQIRCKWDGIVKRDLPGVVPPLRLRPWGFPIDEIARYPTLDDADGFVLLWGEKTQDSLLSQIDQVERKLSAKGSEFPPGIVAYLMPPQKNHSKPMPAWGWEVLRFNAKIDAPIDVVDEELNDLERFLTDVLQRKKLTLQLHSTLEV